MTQASAINLGPTVDAKTKVYDLVNGINARGTWLVSRFALPHLYQSAADGRAPRLLTMSPPLDKGLFELENGEIERSFMFSKSLYTMSKVAMSTAAYALAAETKARGVASNTLWPYTMIGTSAMRIVSPDAGAERGWRSPGIVADAAARILEEDASFTGQFLVDELYLRERHQFTTDQIAEYSLGGRDTPITELEEDLYITQQVRDAVRAYY